MEGDGKNAGTHGRHAQVKRVIPPPPAPPVMEEEERTDPGVDPVVNDAIVSLRRVQADTTKRASAFAQNLVKRRTPVP